MVRKMTENETIKRAEHKHKAPMLERIVAAIGLSIVLSLLGFTARNAVKSDINYPDVAVKAIAFIPSKNGYLVKIRVQNLGGGTAAALTIEGVVKDGEKPSETSYVTFDYLPPHSEREGGLFFSKDPEKLVFELRPLGYQKP